MGWLLRCEAAVKFVHLRNLVPLELGVLIFARGSSPSPQACITATEIVTQPCIDFVHTLSVQANRLPQSAASADRAPHFELTTYDALRA